MTTISSNSVWSDVPPPPLTTIFTPPCGCVDKPARLFGTTIPSTPLDYEFGETCSTWQLCDPVEYITWVCSSAGGIVYAFSPGVCPQDWTAVGTTTSMDGTDTVTTASCCPLGFSTNTVSELQPGYEYQCLSYVKTPTAALHWTDSTLSCGEVLQMPAGFTTVSNFTVNTEFYVVAWRSADLPRFTPASAPLSMLMRESTVTRTDCIGQTYPTSYMSTYTDATGSCSVSAPTAATTKGPVVVFGTAAVATTSTVSVASSPLLPWIYFCISLIVSIIHLYKR